ncbi:Cytosolic carboxypeptidase 1 [Caenorhabditis elegans]|uniref:Cytosolic carboxypeptidase 1 n=1 Tax=Caenorhabditis elegans TaxID=6239 RepID=CBPC1_CAEEL|nr:Cytosolic carboxypeptidase 1 [Caenorhabditis elegans]O76373.2 RecName: Full=Cytosolic carboxypeptidase 1 [Caenorhabditis elegans]CCD62967.1 Cytosolic carboxypeptidase 1 [Caenorhabditis elegans]|eukprot:NP_491674.2 Cytosolic carboxypeptidase 1 [Caenorhabditis elegans]
MPSDSDDVAAVKQPWSQLIVDISNFLSEHPQSKTSQALLPSCNGVWSDEEKLELIEAFGHKKQSHLTKSGVKAVLAAFEGDRTQPDVIFLCRLLHLIFSHFSSENDRKKEKYIVKCDVIATLTRITRKRIIMTLDVTDESSIDHNLDEVLWKLLHKIGLKDPRVSLKVRMGGLISPMCKLFIQKDTLPELFLPFFIKISRSPRNGQAIGRYEGFMTRLLVKIKALDASDQTSQVLLLDKHLQLLFFTMKNKRTRTQLLRENICKYLLEVLRRHLASSSNSRPTRLLSSLFGTFDKSLSAAHTEVVIGTIAILRLLSNFKKARDELKNLQVLDICSRELKEFWSDEWKTGPKSRIVDSLSALCLRCMSPLPYPLETRRFPIDFPLPTATPSTPGGHGRIRNSSSINISFDNGRSSDEDGMDEEDEAFVRDDDDEGKDDRGSDDDDGKDDDEINGALPKTTRLNPQQLAKYAPFFVENEQGTLQPTFSMIYQTNQESWRSICEKTRHVMPIHHHLPIEMFNTPTRIREKTAKTSNNMKKMIIEELDKPERSATSNQVIYDLDTAAFDGLPSPELPFVTGGGKLDTSKDLQFDSRFESGNLRMVIQVAPTHYELFLSPDVNQLRDHYQWFFFQVSNMRKSVKYTFEIVNCLKSTSLYSQGMQPVMYSMMESANGWRRVGENVCYFRNLYINENEEKKNVEEQKKKKYYYSIRFNVTFQNTGDICYIAYHYPYTYSFLNSSLSMLKKRKQENVYCREDVIGHSLAGNPIKMLTITTPASAAEIAAREVIVLSARVHPGETNASWIMQGILENLLCRQSNEMYRLRESFIFKIVPMINPDGVTNGSHRCSLAGIDLNRMWDRPNEALHPEVFATKAIIQYLCEVANKKPFAYVDIHGHSKKWDYFVYGNNASESWRADDVLDVGAAQLEEELHLALPKALEATCPSRFNASECRFNITRAKESSARVNVWRQFGVSTAYTLESTFCGFHKGQNSGYQINTSDLKEIGRDLLHSFLEMTKT